MSKVKVYAPNEAYAGTVGGVTFEAGVAEVDEDALEMRYFRRQGYGVGERSPVLPYDKMEPTVDGTPIDARDYATSTLVGSPLRDAAVDPDPGDFLPPTNAGKANPHGPRVVAPGIHAEGPAGIRTGEVFVDDVRRQERAESAVAESVLVDGNPATDAAVTFDADTNMGPLGLSDPGSADQGVANAVEVAANEAAASEAAPAKPSRPSTPAAKRRSTKTTSRAARPKGTTKP